MQSYIAHRITRTQFARYGRPHKHLFFRPTITPLGSVSTPAESSKAGEGTSAAEPQDTKQPQQDSPQVIDVESKPVESKPVVSLVAQPETTVDAPSEQQPPEAAEPQPSVSSHPVDDVAEELEEDLIASKELVAEVMDGSAFGKRGEQWLFAQVVVMAMLAFPPLALKGLVDFAATVSLTAGLVFIITAFFNLGRSISPLPMPRKKHQLVVSGIYGYVRHPMYGGILLAAFGLAILTRNETRLALLALLWWVLEQKLAVEERALSERYPEYAEYKAKVKKFFPFIY